MIVPKLRFKGFKDDWIPFTLGNITETITSGSRDWAQYYSKSGSKFIRMTNLSRDGIQLKLDDLKFVDIKHGSADGNRTSLVHGDILISITAELGKIGWIPPNFGKAYINQHTALIRLNKAQGNTKFVAFLLSTAKLNRQINKLNDAGAKAGLNLPTIKSIKIKLPTLPEQTKIANFLTAIDEKISQLTQKCDLLAQYKKGVMQQIFSQQIRFKDDDGREFSEWEVKKFGDVFTFINTNSFTRELLNYQSGNVKNIHYGDIHTKYKSNFDIAFERVPYINKDVDLSRIPDENYCKVGDLVIADASEDYNDIGKSIEIINLNGEKVLAGLHTFIARAISKSMKVGFSGYLMQTHYIRKQIKTLATGVSVLGISKANLAKIKICIPSIHEQTKIANFLTAIDDKITHTQAQLAAMKQYKQGLLQQMFV